MAFIAPKIIGGLKAPSPVGELGFVEMTQAVNMWETSWTQVGTHAGGGGGGGPCGLITPT